MSSRSTTNELYLFMIRDRLDFFIFLYETSWMSSAAFISLGFLCLNTTSFLVFFLFLLPALAFFIRDLKSEGQNCPCLDQSANHLQTFVAKLQWNKHITQSIIDVYLAHISSEFHMTTYAKNNTVEGNVGQLPVPGLDQEHHRKGIPNNTTTTNPNPNQFLPEAEAATTIEEAEATMAGLKAAVKQWKQRRWKQRATKMKSRKMEATSDEIISSIRW
ncbi:hypothetical protein LXL04_020377 [Taraxacum kok-saghyz]